MWQPRAGECTVEQTGPGEWEIGISWLAREEDSVGGDLSEGMVIRCNRSPGGSSTMISKPWACAKCGERSTSFHSYCRYCRKGWLVRAAAQALDVA